MSSHIWIKKKRNLRNRLQESACLNKQNNKTEDNYTNAYTSIQKIIKQETDFTNVYAWVEKTMKTGLRM